MRNILLGLSTATLMSCYGFSSVFLFNDSPYELKAVIVAANGSTLGEKVVASQATGYFEDTLGQSNPTSTEPQMQPPTSTSQYPIVPYTVYWYCKGGSLYSTSTEVSAGALASPSAGQGPKYCKEKQGQNPSGQDDYSPE